MKKVDVTTLLLNEYTDGELIAFIAGKLKRAKVYAPQDAEDYAFCFGQLKYMLDDITPLIVAIDERMNGDKAPNIVV